MTSPAMSDRTGRRVSQRYLFKTDVLINFRSAPGLNTSVKGSTSSLSKTGMACDLETSVPSTIKFVRITLWVGSSSFDRTGHVVWVSRSGKECGICFEEPNDVWSSIATIVTAAKDPSTIERRHDDRRATERRTQTSSFPIEQRNGGRRFVDHLQKHARTHVGVNDNKVKKFLRSKSTSFEDETIQNRRAWISELTNTSFEHVGHFSESPESFKGNIENPIGVVHVPVGVAGPLLVHGDHAKGTFFIPLATTEGALVTSYSLGSHIVTRSGGANVAIMKNELRIGPMFVFKTLREARAFVTWTQKSFPKFKFLAEGTSSHLTLLQMSHVMDGRRVILNFHYDTADAMGMNMACKATDAVCLYIRGSVDPEEYWLRSNYNANKKVTANNFINGYGKTVTADVVIPRRLLKILRTTPEAMDKYFSRTLLADVHAVQIGANGHFANGIAAIFIACGQDVASVANSHVGVSTCEVNRDGDLYFSVYISSLLVGTVGGGTAFGTGKECLNMMGCAGSGKSNKFAEIVAATVLAGEIGVCTSIVNGTYITAHETFGRNKPKE